MRLILPGFDKERGPYGFKEVRADLPAPNGYKCAFFQHMLAKKLTDILLMNKQGEDAKRLLEYRAPRHSIGSGDVTGDFAALAAEVLKNRVSKSKENLTLEKVNQSLDTIAMANASRDKGERIHFLMHT